MPEADEVPDYVGMFLSRTTAELALLQEADQHRAKPERTDSNRGWAQTLEPLVAFYCHDLQRTLSGTFADHATKLPADLPASFRRRVKRTAGKENRAFYPIPKHDSQWFLYDCMRHISPRDADTRVLRSLLKQRWMRGAHVIPKSWTPIL